MKKFISFFACLLFLCAFVDAKTPLESYKRYMIMLVHGIGANTMKPHEYTADPENDEHKGFGRKSAIWDKSKDDIDLISENWFGDIAGSLQSRGFLGHVVWYDFYQPWKSPIYDPNREGFSESLSRYLGDRSITNNPMSQKHKYEKNNNVWEEYGFKDGPKEEGYFGRTAQSYWLHEFFPNELTDNDKVTYQRHGKNSFMELAQSDWALWGKIQKKAGLNNEETPKKYILVAHSMGGLTTRDYITGDFYKGDVDKLITLDSPHEGSAIANYVQYWKDGAKNTGKVLLSFGATLAAEAAELLLIGFGEFMTTNQATAPSLIPSILGYTALFSAPTLLTSISSFLGEKVAGYSDVKNLDTDEIEDHTAFGIDVMALDDKNNYGLYQSDTKQFLKDFNNRSSLNDVAGNGYQLPYFRLVSTSGVATPGGPGFHQYTNSTGLGKLAAMVGGMIPYIYEGEEGFLEDASAFNMLFKAATAMGLNSLWNDWGSGFVPHWSSEAKNVKIFNNPKADTKRWNISYDGDRNNAFGGLITLLTGLVVTEIGMELLPWENASLKSVRFWGYVGLVSGYILATDWEKYTHIPSYIGFHGRMAKRVDEDEASDAPSGRGSNKKILDELLWEKPSVSIVYNPVDPQDRSNAQGGRVGISTTKEIVEYTQASVTTNANSESVVDVKWKGETSPHVFDLSLPGAFDVNGNELPKTVNVVGKHVNTTIKGFVLNKTDGSKSIRIDNNNCSAIPVNGWTVVKADEGNLSCDIPALSMDDKGNYTMQLVVGVPSDDNATYGVMVDVDRVPGVAFVEGPALINAQDNDWDRYVTFKSRRKQVKADGSIDATVADMVDYRRASNLVVNKLPRLIEFEVDDLQPDRMNRLSVDFNYGTAKIEFEANNDPNNYSAAFVYKDANGNVIMENGKPKKVGGDDAVSHGFVNTADEEYTLKMSLGSTSCQATVKNPVNAWGKWVLNLDELSATCGIDKYQPFLEGQNHIRIFSENRWLMTRSQDLNIFIPGPPPTISLVYPRDGDVFCGSSKLEFETNLIYALSSPFTANDVSIYYMNGNQRVDINANELDVVQKPDFGSITKYSVSTKNKIAWPEETAVSITVRPKILGNSSTPYTYVLHISQDCVAPTVTISDEQEKYNPTTISFESFDQSEVNGEHLSVQDEIIEIKSQGGSFSKVLSANKFTTFGPKIRSIELKDNAGNDLPDGSYELSVRVHDDAVKDKASDKARRDFWESYKPQPDMSMPFAEYCDNGNLANALSCMTHWTKESLEIIIDHTAPTIENPEFVLKQNNQEFVFNNRYAGPATDKDLVLKMNVSDANLKIEKMVEYTQASVTKNSNNESVVDVKWKNEKSSHVFDFSLKDVKNKDDIDRQKTINIVGLHQNTTIKGIILKKVGEDKVIKIGNYECPMIPENGWTVYKAYQGKLSCVVPMADVDKGSYTMQLIVADQMMEANETYGVAVDVGISPIVAAPEASINFIQVDNNGIPVKNGHSFVQKMDGEYEKEKFVYNHSVAKTLTEELKNAMNGHQPIPDGIYAPVINVVDVAKNVTKNPLSLIFVDMTAPKITDLSVPYTVKSGSMHIITFSADEFSDDQSMQSLTDVHATVNAQCGNQSISYGLVSAIEKNSKINFAFEAVIPSDIKGECLAKVEVFDGNDNVRKGELSFVVDFIPPEITYPEKSNNGNAPELYGRVVIRGSAGNPNLRAGGSFTKYELSYAEINEESIVVGNWEHLGMTVPEGRRCNNPSNVSCSAVDKIGAGDDILGYWDLSKLPDNAKGKTYRIKVETFNEGGYSESDYVDVFVPAATKPMPSITISGSTPNQCDFTDKDATCNIHWNTEFPLERKNGQVRMEILRTNTKSQTTFVDVERIFRNVISKEYFGTPNNTSAKGAYLWIDRNDLNKDENVYHLRLVAGQSATTYTILFSKTKNAVVKIFADGNNTEDLAQSSGEQYSSLTVALNAGESRSYVVKNDAKSQIAWNLQGSTVRTGDDAFNMKFMYTQDPNQDELAFVGQNSTPLLSMLKQSEVFLPLTSAAEQFIWDGKNDALASVPSGSYRVILTLEGLEDGAYDVASKDITVIGKPVILSNVDATPKQVPFDVSYLENSVLKPVKVSFTFNIDQDAVVTAFVRSAEGKKPARELMRLEENGRKTLLDQFYLAGRKENYQVNWDGKYNNTSQALPGDYEFVVQIHGADGNVVSEKIVAFTITNEHMLVDGDVVLRVDGRDDPQKNHVEMEGLDFQIVEGMSDAVLQFAPAGKIVVTDNVDVKVKYSGTQKINTLPFERYSIGVQVHRTKASFWVVAAMSFKYNNDNDVVGTSCGYKNGYSNRFRYYGDENGPYELTFTENGGAQPVYINFVSGEDGTDLGGKMNAVNATLFLIPTYSKSKTEIKKMFGWTSELEMLGRVIGKSWYEMADVQFGEDDKAVFDAIYESFKEIASTVIVWGPKSGSIFVGKDGFGDGFGITTYKGNRDTPIVPDGGRTPSYNSSDYYWDKRCDVGNNLTLTCFNHDVSDAELRQFCAEHPAEGCGNGIADEGEPLLGSTDRYNGLKHSAEFLAEAWAWRNYNGDDAVFDPPGCVGDDDTRHDVMLIASLAPHSRFWGTNGIAYGNGNLVNRYLTLDPMNDNFLFCDVCPFSGNKTPYLNPQHPQHYELVHPKVQSGDLSGQYFIDALHNPNFQMFHEVNGVNVSDNALQPDVQLIFHYKHIMPNKSAYASQPFYADAIIQQPGINGSPFAFALETLGGYSEGGHSLIPIPMGGFSGAGASVSVGIAMNPLWEFGFNQGGHEDGKDIEIEIPWPLKDLSTVQYNCGSNGCGSDIKDKEPYLSTIALESENVDCDVITSKCYKVFTANVTLGSDGLDNGFDMSSGYMVNFSGVYNSIQNGLAQPITNNANVAILEAVLEPVSTGYKVDGSIVRKDEPGCDNNGCDYIANQDPLIYNADFDDDGHPSEDGSVVTLGKRDAYDGFLDSDKDLAMGEDPDNAFRIRLNNMTFNFEAGASSQANWREYKLGDWAGAKLTELQRRDLARGYHRPGAVAEENSVFKQISSDEWTDNPLAKTQWENSNVPSSFTRTKLFYKDGKVNDDVKIFKSEGMDDYDAMQGKIWIGPNDFNGRDRRLLEVHATIPGMQAGEDYKLYASSEIGWIDLTPSTRVTPNAQGGYDGLLAYWDVETSGMHQLMLVRTEGNEKKYKAINVFVGAIANDDKTLFSDAMGRSQVTVAPGSPRVDVIPLGTDEVPQIIPSNKNVGPVVKIYPAVSTLEGNVDLRLRFNRTEVNTNGWTDNGTMYVVSDGYSPRPVDGLTFEFYDANNHQLPKGTVNLSSLGWSYVIISGTVNNTKNNEHKMPKQASVQLGESATLDDATVSVTETSDGVYNVDFNLDANP